MKFKLLPLFIIMVVVVSFVFCGRTKYIQAPDKIVVYNKGISKEIDKNSPEFSKIVELTQKRFHKRLSTARDGIDNEYIERAIKNELGIEFIYYSEQEFTLSTAGFRPFKYYKLFFQLTSEKYGNESGSDVHFFQFADNENYKNGSRGPLVYSEELVRLMQGLMESK